MGTRTLSRTSIFPAPAEEVFRELRKLKTLQFIAKPYATFAPVHGADEGPVWERGKTFAFDFKLFGILPFGRHVIHVMQFDESTHRIYTEESNTHVPIWNHRIRLERLDGGRTQYTDEVEIGAGWRTGAVYLWAVCFYRHRQRKWIRLLRNLSSTPKRP